MNMDGENKTFCRKTLHTNEETLTIEITLENVSPYVDRDDLGRFLDNLYAELKRDYLGIGDATE